MKKDDILKAAARLFAERGFANTSTALLAKKAKVAEGTIFRHFKTKDDIFLDIIVGLHQKTRQEFERNMPASWPGTQMERFLTAIRVFYGFLENHHQEFRLFFRDAPARYGESKDPVFREIQAIYDYITDYFLQIILDGQTDGSIKPNLNAAHMASLAACALVGLARGVHFGFIAPSDAFLQTVLDTFTATLGA